MTPQFGERPHPALLVPMLQCPDAGRPLLPVLQYPWLPEWQ